MSHPDAVFDLAINRAAAFLRGIRPERWEIELQNWHARTRFVCRIPLEHICQALKNQPKEAAYWKGGKQGDWVLGKAKFP